MVVGNPQTMLLSACFSANLRPRNVTSPLLSLRLLKILSQVEG